MPFRHPHIRAVSKCSLPRLGVTGLLAALIVAFAFMPSLAEGAACPSVDTSYTGNCGSTFAVPGWTDASGWTDPSQYSTIRLADVNGDGRDELLGRNSDGIEVYEFDTQLGQWRPQVDGNNHRQLVSWTNANGKVISDFASPSLSNEGDPHRITLPQYYSTIQAANIDGQPGDEILARFWDGMRVYKYFPPAGKNSIDGGTWKRIGTSGPFSDADGYNDPSLYSTIQTGDVDGDGKAELVARTHTGVVVYDWKGSAWSRGRTMTAFSDPDCTDPACYLDLRTADVTGSGTDAVIGRDTGGISTWSESPPGSAWQQLDPSRPLTAPFMDHRPVRIACSAAVERGAATVSGAVRRITRRCSLRTSTATLAPSCWRAPAMGCA